MTQDDYVWVAIRTIGLYLLFQALLRLVDAVSSGYSLALLLDEPGLRERAQTRFIGQIVELLVLAWLGRYLFFDGSRLFSWAKRKRESLARRRAA